MTAFKSTTMPALALELATDLNSDESLLSTPVDRVQINYGADNICRIACNLAVGDAISGGGISLVAQNYAPDPDFVVTGTPLATEAPANSATAMLMLAVKMNKAELAKIAAGTPVAAGSGTSLTHDFGSGEASFTFAFPYTTVINTQGQPAHVATNYLA
jgi:hypothetical protein